MWLFLDDILTEILSRVPSKDLRRLRCVSKSWRTLIDSPFFINMHLNHATRTHSNRTLIFSDVYRLYNLRIQDLLDHNLLMYSHRPFQWQRSSLVLGSCNGLLFVCRGYCESVQNGDCNGNCRNDFGVWNPNTDEYMKLPDPLNLSKIGQNCSDHLFSLTGYYMNQVFGFGYDSMKDDYKVVRVNQYSVSESGILKDHNDADIYSLKSKSWRHNVRCMSIPLNVNLNQLSSTFACGALHWAGRLAEFSTDEWVILAFDMGAEEFRIVPRPDYSAEIKFESVTVEELKGELCLCCTSHGFVDIWIMRVYGTKDSWMKLLSLPISVKSGHCRPLGFSDSGAKILLRQNSGILLMFDLAKYKKETMADIGGAGGSCDLLESGTFLKNIYVKFKKRLGCCIAQPTRVNETPPTWLYSRFLVLPFVEYIDIWDMAYSFVVYSCVDSLVRLSNYGTDIFKLESYKLYDFKRSPIRH